MQYGKSRTSKLTIVSDNPVSMSSSVHGANLDAVGFNINFIFARRPELAMEIMRLADQARGLSTEDPTVPGIELLEAEARQRLQQVFERKR
ncbi:hypothetical protein AB0L41_25800 [Amycolatopsis mediterranei]|uniref:hypothetical protein n=1 Tax=Amycolatopsis mediterranei TaxID=33910 RepID=UPI00341C03FD